MEALNEGLIVLQLPTLNGILAGVIYMASILFCSGTECQWMELFEFLSLLSLTSFLTQIFLLVNCKLHRGTFRSIKQKEKVTIRLLEVDKFRQKTFI